MVDDKEQHWTLRTLLAYLEQQIQHERDQRMSGSKHLAEALEIQATETLRRLDELNHAHENAKDNWRQTLPRELFEQWEREFVKWKEVVNTSLVPISHIARLDARLSLIETIANKMSGALILLGVMGLAGVLALVLGLARLAGLLQ